MAEMKPRMTWAEIAVRYSDQWVGLTDMEWNGGGVRSAVVKHADKSGDELIGMQLADDSLYSTYNTPDNVPFLFTNWVAGAK